MLLGMQSTKHLIFICATLQSFDELCLRVLVGCIAVLCIVSASTAALCSVTVDAVKFNDVGRCRSSEFSIMNENRTC